MMTTEKASDPSPEEKGEQLLRDREFYLAQGLDEKVAECDFELGNVESNLESYDQAREYYLRARSHFARLELDDKVAVCDGAIGSADFNLGNTEVELGQTAFRLEDYDQAREHSLRAREYYHRGQDNFDRARSHFARLELDDKVAECEKVFASIDFNLGNTEVELGKTAFKLKDNDQARVHSLQAREHYLRAREVYGRLGNDKIVADCDTGLGDVEVHLGNVEYRLGAYDQAREHYLRAQEVYGRLGNDKIVAKCDTGLRNVEFNLRNVEFNLGNVEFNLGNYDPAREHYLRAREVYGRLGNDKMVANCDIGLGMTELDLGAYDPAREHYLRAREVYGRLGNDKIVADCDTGLGNVEFNLGNYDQAREHCLRAREVFAHLGIERGVADCDTGLGNVEFNLGNYDLAREYCLRAREVYGRLGNDKVVAKCDTSLGNVEFNLGNYDLAREYYLRAREVFAHLGIERGVADCDTGLGNVEFNLGNYDLAIARYFSAHYTYAQRNLFVLAGRSAYMVARVQLEGGNDLSYVAELVVASGYFKRGIDHFVSREELFNVALCELGYGLSERFLDHKNSAQRQFQSALDHFQSVNAQNLVAECHMHLGDIRLGGGGDGDDFAKEQYSTALGYFVAQGAWGRAAECELGISRALTSSDRERATYHAIRACVLLDRLYYRLRRPGDRIRYARKLVAAQTLALDLASDFKDYVRVAELIESARIQAVLTNTRENASLASATLREELAEAVSVLSQDQYSLPHDVHPATLAPPRSTSAAGSVAGALGDEPLGPPHGVRLGQGSSLGDSVGLGDAPSDVEEPPDVVSIAATAAMIAGKKAHWFGTWVAGDMLYWFLLTPDQQLSAGSTSMGEISPLIKIFQDALPHETETPVEHLIHKSTLTNPKEELELAISLGKALIPEELRRLLSTQDGPMALVVALAPEIALIPFAWLGIDERGTRVLERAVVHLGVSIGVIHEATTRTQRSRSSTTVAVVDPVGNMLDQTMGGPSDAAYQLGNSSTCAHVLTGDTHLEQFTAEIPDTQHNRAGYIEIAESLQKEIGVFFYVGHAIAGKTPASSALILSGCAPNSWFALKARDLYLEKTYPMPERVVLIACGGARQSNREWLGLAPAALFSGAHFVLAALWNLVWGATSDDPTFPTWRLALRALDVAQHSNNPVMDWRAVQLEELMLWRQTQQKSSSPLFWAGLAALSVSLER